MGRKLLNAIKTALYYNISEPYPNRRLQHIMSIPYRGRRFICRHRYAQTGFHEDILNNSSVSIRHYECTRCKRCVHVYGPGDDLNIETSIRNT